MLIGPQTPEVLVRQEEIKVLAITYEDKFFARYKVYPDITRARKGPIPKA